MQQGDHLELGTAGHFSAELLFGRNDFEKNCGNASIHYTKYLVSNNSSNGGIYSISSKTI